MDLLVHSVEFQDTASLGALLSMAWAAKRVIGSINDAWPRPIRAHDLDRSGFRDCHRRPGMAVGVGPARQQCLGAGTTIRRERPICSAPLQGFFGRATRTLANNIESTLMWAPPVLAILILHRTTWLSQLFAVAYIGVRIIFTLSYWLKIPVLRSLAWFAGMICCAVLAAVPVR